MPDIDVDFCYERRQEVIDYVISKYGEDHVAQIVTFGTLAARAAIKDVGRALAMPYADVDRISKMIPTLADGTLDPISMATDTQCLNYQIPGGMLSNLISQLKMMNAIDKLDEALAETPKVRADLAE